MNKRKIVKIDEEKCNGCGDCVPACHEGAIRIINGKARLVADNLCDGIGDCLGHCPQGAITIEERVADSYDEKAVEKHLEKKDSTTAPCGCPSAMPEIFSREKKTAGESRGHFSRLEHWPVQLMLIQPGAPFLKGKELVLAADCTAYAFGAFHDEFLEGKALAILCPKFGNREFETRRLADIIKSSGITGITTVTMEVPCCKGLLGMLEEAFAIAGKKIPVKNEQISLGGEIMDID